MEGWLEDLQRKEAARWERGEREDAFVPAARSIRVGSTDVEVVKTLADATVTAVFYRVPLEAMVHPQAVWPAELVGGSHGTSLGDTQIAHFNPVLPERSTIALAFGPPPHGVDATRLVVPVDRGRTARHDRFLAHAPASVEHEGVRTTVLDAAAGLVQAVVEVLLEATDRDVLALQLGRHHWGPHPQPQRGPGPAELWREWFPPPADLPRRTSGARGFAQDVAVAVAAPDAGAAKKPPPLPEPPWTVAGFTTGTPLAAQGESGHGGPPLDTPASTSSLRFDVPLAEEEGVEVTIRRLYVFRYGGGQILTLPAPSREGPVSLEGMGFEHGGERLELLSWEAAPDGYKLLVRPPSPDWWADLRILADGASVSLWTGEPEETIRLGLPRIYDELFEKPGGVKIALRLVGQPVEPIRLSVPLGPPGAALRSR